MINNRHPPDIRAGAALFSQPLDDPRCSTSALAAGFRRPSPGRLEIAREAENAEDPETIVWIFEALTGRSATAVERLKLLTRLEVQQGLP